ncbi:MAG: LacI family DNA-binding transcriptional regulator [Candidatus Omnitrophica bacterium]|nr:LacI family DNA-binding transcriptional regulator [Candidatus Omnitrophota bacterium]
MSSSKVTIKEVAQRANVSIATVSRYLNKPTSIKKDNRTRVEKAIQELNYHPLFFARLLAGGKLNTFGLIIPGYEGIFYSFYAQEIVRGVASALEREAIDLHLHIFGKRDSFNSSLVEGVIFADVIGNEAQLRRLLKEEVPVVVMNKKVDDPGVSFVAIDNFKGAYDATEFLITHGHTAIVHLGGDPRVQCAQERVEGYKAALAKHAVPVNEDYLCMTHFSCREARDHLEVLFAGDKRPTAIFCCSDEVAKEVIAFAEEKGIAVPDDLSVIGFDDNPLLAYGNVLLTTVRQPFQQMASSAVKLLKESARKNAAPQQMVLDPELVIRDTVGFISS